MFKVENSLTFAVSLSHYCLTSCFVLTNASQNPTIAHYAGYTEEELMPCFLLMVDYLTGPVKHDAFFKKYAHKKFMKGKHCSPYNCGVSN